MLSKSTPNKDIYILFRIVAEVDDLFFRIGAEVDDLFFRIGAEVDDLFFDPNHVRGRSASCARVGRGGRFGPGVHSKRQAATLALFHGVPDILDEFGELGLERGRGRGRGRWHLGRGRRDFGQGDAQCICFLGGSLTPVVLILCVVQFREFIMDALSAQPFRLIHICNLCVCHDFSTNDSIIYAIHAPQSRISSRKSGRRAQSISGERFI